MAPLALNRFADWFTKLLVVWVVAAALLGYLSPQVFLPTKAFSDLFFSFTMFGIGCLLSAKDFEPIFKKPKFVFLGVLAQFAIMPVLAFLIVKLLNIPPALAIGLILAGSVPDAMAAGVMSYLAEADVAFSVALTVATTLVSPVATPGLTYLLGRQYISIQFWPMFTSIMIMVIIPLLAGLATQHFFHKAVLQVKPIFPAFSTLFIAFICGLVVSLNKNALGKTTVIVIIGVALLNIFGLLFGYLAGMLFRFDIKKRRTLAIGVGMQNAGMGAVLAIKHFSPESSIPNALFATWCIVTAAILAEIWRKKPAIGSS
jgi:BASS family bile acid:Na+ symporter